MFCKSVFAIEDWHRKIDQNKPRELIAMCSIMVGCVSGCVVEIGVAYTN